MLNKINNNFYYLEYDEESDRPNIGYVKGHKLALMLDAGISKAHVKAFYQALENNHLKRPDLVVLTHHHYDHSYGLAYLPVLSIASTTTNKYLEEMMTWKWDNESMLERVNQKLDTQFAYDHLNIEYQDPCEIRVKPCDITFDKQMRLDLGGLHALLSVIDSPHCDGCVNVLIEELGILFSGDSACSQYINGEWVYDQEALSNYLNYLYQTPFDIMVSGHTFPQTKKEVISELEEDLRKMG